MLLRSPVGWSANVPQLEKRLPIILAEARAVSIAIVFWLVNGSVRS